MTRPEPAVVKPLLRADSHVSKLVGVPTSQLAGRAVVRYAPAIPGSPTVNSGCPGSPCLLLDGDELQDTNAEPHTETLDSRQACEMILAGNACRPSPLAFKTHEDGRPLPGSRTLLVVRGTSIAEIKRRF